MAWTGKSGWFQKRFSVSKIPGSKPKPSAKRRRQRSNMPRPVEGLEPRLLLTGVDSPLALNVLDGSIGFRLVSGPDDGIVGDDVQNIGDMNGDGYDDLLVTSPVDEDRSQGRGQAYVIFGSSNGFPAEITPSTDLDGANGFVITADSNNDFIIDEVDAIGDFNADGFADLIVLSENDSSALNDSHVIFGHGGDFSSRLDVRQLDGVNGFSIQSGSGISLTQRSVTGLGDVNGDGVDDIFVGGSLRTIPSSSPAVGFAVYGHTSESFDDIVLSEVTSDAGLRIEAPGSFLFAADAADFNRDGINDFTILTVAFDDSESRTGPFPDDRVTTSAFVVYGRSQSREVVDVSQLDGSSGFEIVHGNAAEDVLGPAPVGDVTDDGIDDLLIETLSGLQVVAGSSDFAEAELQLPAFGPENDAERFYSFDFDFNADGIPDGITSSSPDSEAEQRIVLGDVGDRSLPENSYDLTGFDFVEVGSPASGETITGSTGIGDLNGDGFDDAIFAAETSSGDESLYIVFGFGVAVKGNQSLLTAEHDLFGTSSGADVADVLVGLAGDDSLYGDGGPDAFFGGAGNDVVVVQDDSFRVVDGGSGFDTFVPDVNFGSTLDLTAMLDRRFIDIEAIDLRKNTEDTLTLDQIEILRLSSTTNTLRVLKDVDDVVNMGDGWTKIESITEDWKAFDVYEQGGARLEIQTVIPSFLPTLDGTQGIHLVPNAGGKAMGKKILQAGDINGDGLSDLMIHSEGYGGGESTWGYYIVFGSDESSDGSLVPATDLDGSNGFHIKGDLLGARSIEIESGGDFNGDGYADLIAITADRFDSGSPELHVIFGQAEPFSPILDLGQLKGSNGFTVQLEDEHELSSAQGHHFGDMNGDGFDDVLIKGGFRTSGASSSSTSAAYLLFGRSGDNFESFTLDEFDKSHGVRIGAPGFGGFVVRRQEGLESADINSDGFDDFFFYVRDLTRETGDFLGNRQFVVYGSATWAEQIDLSAETSVAVEFQLDHYLPNRIVNHIAPVNDVTGDGLDDLLVFTFDFDGNPWEVHTIPGGAKPLDAVLALSKVDARDPATAADYPFWNTNFDFNGDGLNDSIRSRVDDPWSGTGSKASIITAIVLGEGTVNAGGSGTSGATTSYGAVPGDLTSREVIYYSDENGTRSAENIGDFNGDGYDDLALTDWRRRNGVYVLFGSSIDQDAVFTEGTTGNDQLTASGGAGVSDLLVGLSGDDTLTGDGGSDTLLGGAGDDVFRVTDTEFLVADGGSGFDTLLVLNEDVVINLRDDSTADLRLKDIEAVDLRNDGPNRLLLDLESVIRMTPASNRLRINQGKHDQVLLGFGWTNVGISVSQGQRFEVWQNGPAVVDLEIVESGTTTPGQTVLEFGDAEDSDQEFTLAIDGATSELVVQITGGTGGPREHRHSISTVAGVRFEMGGGEDQLQLYTRGFT